MDEFLERFEAKRKAREDADRTVTLAGEALVLRPTIAPEVVFKFRESQTTMYEDLTALRDWGEKLEKAQALNGDGDPEQIAALQAAMPESRLTDDELIQIADETVVACLDADSADGWFRLRSKDNPHPLEYQEVFEIVGYLLGKVAQIPTVAPSDSSDGRTQTAKPSTAGSSSPAKTPAASA